MVSANHILMILHGAIGDVVRALPLLTRLRAGYPGARITWAVEPIAAPLLAGHPALDDCVVFDRPRGLPAFMEFLGRIRRLRADVALDLQRHLKSGVVSRVSGAPLRFGFHRRNAKEGNWLFNNRHLPPLDPFGLKLQQYLVFADVLGVAAAPVQFGLVPNEEERSRVQQMLEGRGGPLAAIFVGSTWPSRFWFADRNAEVVRGLRARGFEPVLLGGVGERAFAEEIARLAGVPVSNLAGKTNLRDLIALFDRSAVAVGPDSGPMHIAAAMGCRVISLWGATSPARSAPWGSEDLVIQGEAECSPCYKRHCPIGRVCMQNITPASVLAKVDVTTSAHEGSKI
ncbi:MAG TPA: glycosyltransferase family 9 protein [Candidatus Kryptonia bacterium]|nr:glycosyltransferase family 9 protein [Candidatus Kryptonia bacterium]